MEGESLTGLMWWQDSEEWANTSHRVAERRAGKAVPIPMPA